MGAPPMPPETRTLEQLFAQGTVTVSRAGLVADLHVDDDRRQRWVRLATVKGLRGEAMYRFEGLIFPVVAAAIAAQSKPQPSPSPDQLAPTRAPLALVKSSDLVDPNGDRSTES